MIILNNGSRAGAIANMTIAEHRKAVVENGSYIISVLSHKTVASTGPANLALMDQLYKLLNTYIQNMRNRLTVIDVIDGSKVFVSWTG